MLKWFFQYLGNEYIWWRREANRWRWVLLTPTMSCMFPVKKSHWFLFQKSQRYRAGNTRFLRKSLDHEGMLNVLNFVFGKIHVLITKNPAPFLLFNNFKRSSCFCFLNEGKRSTLTSKTESCCQLDTELNIFESQLENGASRLKCQILETEKTFYVLCGHMSSFLGRFIQKSLSEYF